MKTCTKCEEKNTIQRLLAEGKELYNIILN